MPPPTPANERKAEHTPTPWREHDMESDAIVGPDRKAIALVMGRSRSPEEDAANLAFILTAVNSYASLRQSNEEMRRALENVITEAGTHTEYNPIGKCDRLPLGYQHVIELARAALARAQALQTDT